MTVETITLTKAVPAGGAIVTPAALNDGDQIVATVHVPPPAITIASSIGDGTTISGKVSWQVVPTTAAPVLAVDFSIDGKVLWVEHFAPYVFNGDGNTLDTTTLAEGLHHLGVTVVTSAGSASLALAVTVANAVQPPIVLPFPGLQQAHDQAAPGSTILIPPGTYQPLAPFQSTKTGLHWKASGPGVVFDFSKAVCQQQQAAFDAHGPQTIIEGFRTFGGLQSRRVGNVVGFGLSGDSCQAIDMESDHFGEMGFRVEQTGTNYLILRGKIHDNNLDLPALLAAGGKAASGGNVPPFSPGWEAGGGKIWHTNGIVDGLEGWNNYGPTVWPDTGNHDTILRNMRIHDSPYVAIMWEVSLNVQILNNVVWECAWNDGYTGGARDFWSAGILVASGGTAIVRGNLVAWCPKGVIFASQTRPDMLPMVGCDADGNLFAISGGTSHFVGVSYTASDPAISPIVTPNAAATAAQLTAAGVPLSPQAGH